MTFLSPRQSAQMVELRPRTYCPPPRRVVNGPALLRLVFRDIPVGVLLIGGLWTAVHVMVWGVSLWDPSRLPS